MNTRKSGGPQPFSRCRKGGGGTGPHKSANRLKRPAYGPIGKPTAGVWEGAGVWEEGGGRGGGGGLALVGSAGEERQMLPKSRATREKALGHAQHRVQIWMVKFGQAVVLLFDVPDVHVGVHPEYAERVARLEVGGSGRGVAPDERSRAHHGSTTHGCGNAHSAACGRGAMDWQHHRVNAAAEKMRVQRCDCGYTGTGAHA